MFFKKFKVSFAKPQVAVYDGDEQTPAQAPQTPAQTPQTPAQAPVTKLFTQDEVNAIDAKTRKEFTDKLAVYQAQLSEASKNGDSEALLQKINEMDLLSKTKEQQALDREKKLKEDAANQLKALTTERDAAISSLRSYRIENELTSAAVSGDAFQPRQLVTQLKPYTEVNAEGRVQVKGLFETDEGKPSLHSPEEAVKWMKDNPEQHGNLFRSFVVGGIGGNSGVSGSYSGKVDVKKLTPEQYRKLRAENPSAVGL